MQRYASDVPIQSRSGCADDDALLQLEQISVLLVPDNLEIVTCDMHVTT